MTECCMKAMLVVVVFIFGFGSGSGGLKVTNLSVPELADVRSSAVLTCEFDLDGKELYSVKWFKDGHEFFRYVPSVDNVISVLKVKGVHLDMKRCNETTVTLSPLEFTSTGVYRCEVTLDDQRFSHVSHESPMAVIGVPTKNPLLRGFKTVYSVGDFVEGNCTSDKSYPPPILEWYINDNQIEPWQLVHYSHPENGTNFELKSSALGVSFQADNSHFSGKGYTMRLKCVAKVRSLKREATHVASLADIDSEKNAQGLLGSSGSVPIAIPFQLHILLIVLFEFR